MSVQLDVGDEPPGTLTYLAESTTRAKAWVTYAEGCYKYALNTVLRMQDEADEAAKIKLENVEMLNEIRALRNAAAEAEAEAQKKAYVLPEEPLSPSKAKPPAPASDAVIPSPKRERRLGTNMEEEKHRALAEEATRRYEALLAELTDERQARASEGRRRRPSWSSCARWRRPPPRDGGGSRGGEARAARYARVRCKPAAAAVALAGAKAEPAAAGDAAVAGRLVAH